MHTKKLLAMISTVAVLGTGTLKTQPSDSNIPAPMPQRPGNRLSPEMEAKVRQVLRETIAKLNAEDMARAFGQGGLSPEMEARVRETLHQAEADLDAKDKAATEAIKQKQALALAAQERIFAEGDAQRKAAADLAAKQKAEADRAAREKKEAELAAKHKAAPPAEAKSTPSAEAPAKTAQNNSTAPSTMAASSKEQRLSDLLQQYKADKISPAEYHEQRAKILAEP